MNQTSRGSRLLSALLRIIAGCFAILAAVYGVRAIQTQLRWGFEYLGVLMLLTPIALAVLCGWFAWRGGVPESRIRMGTVAKGGLILGGIGFAVGYVGPLLWAPKNNIGPLLGVFVTGPLGFTLGLVLGWLSPRFPKSTAALDKWTRRVGWKVAVAVIGITVAAVVFGIANSEERQRVVRSSADMERGSSKLRTMGIGNLRPSDWRSLGKFSELEVLTVLRDDSGAITDEHLLALSRCELPKLRQLNLRDCPQVTDRSLEALAALSSLQGLQLIGTDITDRGLQILADEFPNLKRFNVRDCKKLTPEGFVHLGNSRSVKEVSFSVGTFSEEQIETIISKAPNVTWWTIGDPHHRLDHAALRKLGETRDITIQVVNGKNAVTSITQRAHRNIETSAIQAPEPL